MSLKINRKTTEQTLTDNLENDAKLLADSATLFAFAAAAMSGEPLGLAAGAALILKTAAAAARAGTNVVRRLSSSRGESVAELPLYERFRLLFFVTCQQSYIEALAETVNNHQKGKQPASEKIQMKTAEVKALTAQLKVHLLNLDEAEITYLFCIEPLSGDVPLYDAFEKWTISVLCFYGYPAAEAVQISQKSNQEARRRFHVFLASKEEGAEWMRNYLALTTRQTASSRLVTDLAAIRETIVHWTEQAQTLKQAQKNAWESYRAVLAELPDQKETMFNEQFGVRKVFVQPQASYHVQGSEGDAGLPQSIPDLGRLLGALFSSRVSGEDLVVLCGGPGSGKSTLCRIMASELASDSQVHPVFLRLRRAKEGAEIGQFIEDSLQNLGLINRLADLREIPNLILILDGFDELVMASRSRLRHFFNVLREDLSSGPLRNAKAIVSGRDTLFPRGEGLPNGSHVLSLQPFNKVRVRAWGTKWRLLHKKGPGSSFHPEEFIEKEERTGRKPPLHHLVSWPLTLHLVARVHTAGKLEVRSKAAKRLEKAYLYRSILAETSDRQSYQAEGVGRLDSKKMREFLRALAWEMHSRSIDSMDPSDVMPLLQRFYPDKTEQDLAELAEVAVVNSPELTKGEQTGFEFVHKSFAEFLVAEEFAELVEKVAFKSPDYGSDEPTWRMSEQEAARELAPVLAIRPIPEEVQEMFEPMLGSFARFAKGERVDDVVTAESREAGLAQIVDRFEMLYADFLRGGSLDTVAKVTTITPLIKNALEAYTNYLAGLLIIGTAGTRQLRPFSGKGRPQRRFAGEPFRGAFWRGLCLLAAGGVVLDDPLSGRLLDGIELPDGDESNTIRDTDSPLKLGFLVRAQGYKPAFARILNDSLRYSAELELQLLLTQIVMLVFTNRVSGAESFERVRHEIYNLTHYGRRGPIGPWGDLRETLVQNGLIPSDVGLRTHESDLEFRDLADRLLYEVTEGGDPSRILHFLRRRFRTFSPMTEEYFYRLEHMLRDRWPFESEPLREIKPKTSSGSKQGKGVE
jgi:hypothetical protein